MYSKQFNYFSAFLILIVFCNFFHFFNYLIFPIRKFSLIPNLVIEMNIYFFLIPFFFLYIIYKDVIIKFDKIIFYFLFLFIYYLGKEYLYTNDLYFLDLKNPNAITTINFINLIVGYFLISLIVKNIEPKTIYFSLQITFILFSILIIYYYISTKLFSYIFIEQNNFNIYEFIIKINFYEYAWSISQWFRHQSTFTSNSILYAYSIIFFITFEYSKYQREKIIYFIIYILISYTYLSYTHSRTGLIIIILTSVYFFYNLYNSKFYRLALLTLFSSLILFLFIQSDENFSKTFSKNLNSIKVSYNIINKITSFNEYKFNKEEIKKTNPLIQSYGEVESDLVRIATVYQLFKAFLDDKRKLFFGMSAKEAIETKVLNYSNHSLLIHFISIFGVLIIIISIYLLILYIGFKKFKKNQTYFLLTFLLIVTLLNYKIYSYYSIIIYLLVNKNIKLRELYEKN